MDVPFPLFAFEKDDRSMYLIEEPSRILYQLEAIDIENDEYVFWDVNGAGVCITASWKSGKVTKVASCPPQFPLSDAFESYVKANGLLWTFGEGSPIEIWQQIQAEVSRLPQKTWFLQRLLSWIRDRVG